MKITKLLTLVKKTFPSKISKNTKAEQQRSHYEFTQNSLFLQGSLFPSLNTGAYSCAIINAQRQIGCYFLLLKKPILWHTTWRTASLIRWLSSTSRVAVGRHGDTMVGELASFPSQPSFKGPQNFLKLNRFIVLIPTWENKRTPHKNVETKSDCMWGECERENSWGRERMGII